MAKKQRKSVQQNEDLDKMYKHLSMYHAQLHIFAVNSGD